MADPLSAAASAIAVAILFLQSTSILVHLVSTVKGAPKEVETIANDVRVLDAVVRGLRSALQKPAMVTIVDGDDTIRGLIDVISNALNNCATAADSVVEHLQQNLRMAAGGQKISTFQAYSVSLHDTD